MKRYIKVHYKWLDTLESLKNGICYLQIGKYAYEVYTDAKIGKIQAETDEISETGKIR